MPERPSATALGTILKVRRDSRLFEVEMLNGFCTLAVQPKHGPAPPRDPEGRTVELSFSPYDMSRGKIIRWVTAPDSK